MQQAVVFFLFVVSILVSTVVRSQLTPDFYDDSCPQLFSIATERLQRAVQTDQRLPASLLRLHFHDCFVNGCDASILLDDTDGFSGEKNANSNRNSARGFEVIDDIKSEVEDRCPETVSCADILALVARDSVVLSGGPSWEVPLGRRDSFGASRDAANRLIPSPASDVPTLIAAFQAVGLSASDMFILSGAHTIGAAKCSSFSQRLYNQSGSGLPDPSIDPGFLASLQRLCPLNGDPNSLARLDFQTPTRFDNSYYQNLLSGRGLLNSDQVLVSSGGSSEAAVEDLSGNQDLFFDRFASSMIRMGNINPLLDSAGEIRSNCRLRNSDY